jgi:methyl-accepting chemotaxis protein
MKHFKLSVKLIGGFLAIAAITLAVGIIGFSGVTRLGQHLTEVSTVRLPSLYGMNLMSRAQVQIQAAARTLLIPGLEKARLDHEQAQMKAAWDMVESGWRIYALLPRTPAEELKWKQFGIAWQEWKRDQERFIGLFEESQRTAGKAAYTSALEHNLNAVAKSFQAAAGLLDELAAMHKADADTAQKTAAADAAWARQATGIGTPIGVLVALALGILLALAITRPIKNVAHLLSTGAEQTATAANQLSAASQSLAEGATEQAAALEQTSASLEEMSSVTKHNADQALKANELAKQTRLAADNGATDMQAMSVAMEAIKSSSDDIAKIIKIIDEIAFQTNILALNAAVEAARAGEAGMGFAVVAEEVRNLAQRSAQAAKETAEKIESAIAKTEQGRQISAKVIQGLQEIVTKIRQVDALASEVALATKEQQQGIQQISSAVRQMDRVTQANAASAEQSASAAEQLSAQADALSEAMAELLRVVEGDLRLENRRPNIGLSRAEEKTPQLDLAKPKTPVPGNGHNQSWQTIRGSRGLAGTDSRKDSPIPLDADFKDF